MNFVISNYEVSSKERLCTLRSPLLTVCISIKDSPLRVEKCTHFEFRLLELMTVLDEYNFFKSHLTPDFILVNNMRDYLKQKVVLWKKSPGVWFGRRFEKSLGRTTSNIGRLTGDRNHARKPFGNCSRRKQPKREVLIYKTPNFHTAFTTVFSFLCDLHFT